MQLRDAILKRIMDWVEAETALGFGDVVPTTEGPEDETGPAPEPPYIMVEMPSYHDPVRGELEQWHEGDGSGGIQKMQRGYYKSSVTLNVFGRTASDYLIDLEGRTGSIDTVSIRPVGPINDLSAISKRTSREARYGRDWEVRYGLLFEPDTNVTEFEKLEVTTNFDGVTGTLSDTFIVQ